MIINSYKYKLNLNSKNKNKWQIFFKYYIFIIINSKPNFFSKEAIKRCDKRKKKENEKKKASCLTVHLTGETETIF